MKSILHRPLTAAGGYTITDKTGSLIYRAVSSQDALQVQDAAGKICYTLAPSSPAAFAHPSFEVTGQAGRLGSIRAASTAPLALQADFCDMTAHHSILGNDSLQEAGRHAGTITASLLHPNRLVIDVKETKNQAVAILLALAMDLLRRASRAMVN